MPSTVRRLPQRAVGVLRRGIASGTGRVNIATVVAIAIGTVLVAIEAALAGLWLAAVGTGLLGAAAAVVATKVHKTAVFSARTNRQLRQGARAASGSNAASEPNTAPTTASAHEAEPQQPTDRLHTIGVFQPQVVNTVAKGRQAAAVKEDPDRPFRLYAATQGAAGPTGTPLATGSDDGRRIAAVATAPLAGWLSAEFAVTRLHPGVARAELEVSQPSALLIQEDALRDGPWYSTLEASGVGLLREVLELIATCRERGIMVYAVASESLELSTTTLRQRVSMVVHPGREVDLGQVHGAGVHRPLIDRLNALPAANHPNQSRKAAS